MTGFTPLLRLAWRDLWRNRGRTTVVFLMILLPVLGVSAASTVIATAQVSGSEGVSRVMGGADFVVTREGDDFNDLAYTYRAGSSTTGGLERAAVFAAKVRTVLGSADQTALRVAGSVRATTDKGATRVVAVEEDLGDPLFEGTFRLVSGNLPRSADEVVVNRFLADRGPGLGDKLEIRDGATLKVVGLVEDRSNKDPARAWGLPGSMLTTQSVTSDVAPALFVAGGPGAAASASEALHQARLASWTRGEYEDMLGGGGALTSADVAVFVLVVVMVLTEVVLLAGPAFAVSARRRQRELALVAANGGTPHQVRAAVLTSAFVIGGLAAALGAVGGVVTGWLASPVAERFGSQWFGPRDWSPLQVAGVAAFGLVSAVLAALVPAWIASRQDVVRVLTGRRGDPAPAKLSPALGVLLMLVGAGLTLTGVRGAQWGEIWIGFGAVATVLGAVALMPLLLGVVARLTGRAPLVIRYALRDGLRHRTRTVPAIGAVMATVAGVVALGIANASDSAAGEKTYQPSLPMGHAQISVWGDLGVTADDLANQWAAVLPAVTAIDPDVSVLRGVLDGDVSLRDGKQDFYADYSGSFNLGIVVAPTVPDLGVDLSDADRARADAVLAKGGLVAFVERDRDVARARTLTVTGSALDPDDPNREMKPRGSVTVPSVVLPVDRTAPAGIVLSDKAARGLGLEVGTASILINHSVSHAEAKELEQAVTDHAESSDVYVERGWQPDSEYRIIMLVLTIVGALLMIGGTLTATVLALADAGPDLAMLSAVGAAPRTSRGVAMAIAFMIGGLGAVLGVLVGAVPGIAATWPLTSRGYQPYGIGSGGPHTIDIPWLLLAEIAVGVPVLLALAVGLFARSRLPLVARID